MGHQQAEAGPGQLAIRSHGVNQGIVSGKLGELVEILTAGPAGPQDMFALAGDHHRYKIPVAVNYGVIHGGSFRAGAQAGDNAFCIAPGKDLAVNRQDRRADRKGTEWGMGPSHGRQGCAFQLR